MAAPIVQCANVDCLTMPEHQGHTDNLLEELLVPYPSLQPAIHQPILEICNQYQIVIDLNLRLQGRQPWYLPDAIIHTPPYCLIHGVWASQPRETNLRPTCILASGWY